MSRKTFLSEIVEEYASLIEGADDEPDEPEPAPAATNA
jgi:hypothetical protein